MQKKGFTLLGVLVSMFWLSGCVGTPDSEGWRSSQKEQFLQILQEDRYASLCDLKPLYEKVKETHNSKLMSKLLVEYANNLANSCIDIPAFQRAQEARVSDEFKADYEIYKQKVDASQLKMQLQAGVPFAQMFAPYVPKYREWQRLLTRYHALRNQPEADLALVKRVKLNLERVKLFRPLTTPSYALINIPEFNVRIIDNNTTAVKMRVVVGKQKMQTPIFSEYLKYIVVNPQWNVPDSIARKEIIPKALRNPNYLASHRLEVRRDYNLDSPKLDFNSLNAKVYVEDDTKRLPFKFIEPPSKKNGLGRVKFLFPNKHSVYMHDTQSKYLFKRAVRTFSHGCIRLSKPTELLEYIVTHYTNMPWEEAKEKYDSFKTHYITLTKPLQVHTAYLTTYVEDNGILLQFNDIYGYDAIQHLKE